VTVQNLYNLANRQDDALVARCAEEGIAFAPFSRSVGPVKELDGIAG
jgi:aryl-alcohol dehydrogenase-like predicted oxidoreductase